MGGVSLKFLKKEWLKLFDFKIYCYCHNSEINSIPTVRCDRCSDWFHLELYKSRPVGGLYLGTVVIDLFIPTLILNLEMFV